MKSEVFTGDYLISVYDIENFVKNTKNLSTPELFDLMNQIQGITIETLRERNPIVIKNLGDSNLMIFDTSGINLTISALYSLKSDLEQLLKNRGVAVKVSFSSHCGEISVGSFGIEPFSQTDAFGEGLNRAFLLNGKPYRGRFTISPELFRKLGADSRKRFHKYTPRIKYTSD